nr:pyrroline-5-carboxylate reductase [Raoultella sp. NCTC 9187]
MEKKIGFIGCGNMGKAILGGLIASGQVQPGQIWVYTPSPDKVAALHDQYGIKRGAERPGRCPGRRYCVRRG